MQSGHRVRWLLVCVLFGGCTTPEIVDCVQDPERCDLDGGRLVIAADGGTDAGIDGGGLDGGPNGDAGVDAGTIDAGVVDAGIIDAGMDAGMDAGRMIDAGCSASEIAGDSLDADEDCNGVIACFVDGDDDGYRRSLTIASVDGDCSDSGEARASAPLGDCNDSSAAIHPGASDIPGDPGNLDENCDGIVRCYADNDDDGARTNAIMYASSGTCTGANVEYASSPIDCCDVDADTYPGSTRASTMPNGCSSYDYDCDGNAEPQDTMLGSCGTPSSCTAVRGWETGVPDCGVTARRIYSCTQVCSPGPCRCIVNATTMSTQSCQ